MLKNIIFLIPMLISSIYELYSFSIESHKFWYYRSEKFMFAGEELLLLTYRDGLDTHKYNVKRIEKKSYGRIYLR